MHVMALQGSRPLVLVCSKRGKEIGIFQTGLVVEAGQKEKQNVMTVKKPISAAAIDPRDSNLVYLLHEDCTISANSINLAQHTLTELWQHSLASSSAATEARIDLCRVP